MTLDVQASGRWASGINQPQVFTYTLLVALGAAFSVSWYVLWLGWDLPLLDQHAFRQTQTALTVYWMLAGGHWVIYETPVIGSPWAIPLEFPIYQWLVLVVTPAFDGNIDQAGRAVSYVMFVLSFWPLGIIFKRLKVSREAFLATVALVLMAPTYLFWGRTVLIESTALLFSLSFLACYMTWLQSRRGLDATGVFVFLVAALLAKVTTAVPIGLLAALLTVPALRDWFAAGCRRELIPRLTVIAAVVGFSFGILVFWVYYTESVRNMNPVGQLFPPMLSHWNFGSLEQRLDLLRLASPVDDRIIPHALGSNLVLFLIAGMAFMVPRRNVIVAGLFLFGWLLALLIFTNLHFVHDYYQFANAIFLLAAAGVVIAGVASFRPTAGALALVLVLFLQFQVFRTTYQPRLHIVPAQERTMLIAEAIQAGTPVDSAIAVFGYEWSSEVAYYAQRRSLTLPTWTSQEILQEFAVNPASFVAPYSLSAVVVCRDNLPPTQLDVADAALARLRIDRVEHIKGCQVSFVGSVDEAVQ